VFCFTDGGLDFVYFVETVGIKSMVKAKVETCGEFENDTWLVRAYLKVMAASEKSRERSSHVIGQQYLYDAHVTAS